MAVGIVDIAKRLNVSHTTVSRVLNNRHGSFVSEQTRRQILSAARDMGYRPNRLARGLRGAKTETLGVAVPGFFKQIDHVETQARKAGYRIHMAAHHRKPVDLERVLDDFIQHNVDGILIHSIVDGMEQILEKVAVDKPVVLCCEEPVAGFDCFIDARYQAARLAMSYLIDRGHQRIGLLVNHTQPEMRWRTAGYRDELTARGIAVDGELMFDMPLDRPSASRGYAGLRHALQKLAADRRPTAILCTNDDVAVGALAAAAEMGLRVPEDLSVMGMMNLEHAPFARVPLTTVDWDAFDLIAKGMARLIERIRRPDAEVRVVIEPPKIVERASVTSIARLKEQ